MTRWPYLSSYRSNAGVCQVVVRCCISCNRSCVSDTVIQLYCILYIRYSIPYSRSVILSWSFHTDLKTDYYFQLNIPKYFLWSCILHFSFLNDDVTCWDWVRSELQAQELEHSSFSELTQHISHPIDKISNSCATGHTKNEHFSHGSVDHNASYSKIAGYPLLSNYQYTNVVWHTTILKIVG